MKCIPLGDFTCRPEMLRRFKRFVILGLFLTTLYLLSSPLSNRTERNYLNSELATVIVARKRNGFVLGHNFISKMSAHHRLHNISGKNFFNPEPGALNFHKWNDLCNNNIQSLRNHPMFPKVPSTRQYISNLELSNQGENHGKRIFGYLELSQNIRVEFKLFSSGSSEFWVSTNFNPENCRIICSIDNRRKHEEICREAVSFEPSKLYYFEILHKHGTSNDHLKLKWKIFGRSGGYELIPAKHFRRFQDDKLIADDTVHSESFPSPNLPMHHENGFPKAKFNNAKIGRSTIFRLPFMDDADTKHLFPSCSYSPSYLLGNLPLKKYESIWRGHYTAVFPPDNSTLHYSLLNNIPSFGNDVMDKIVAADVVDIITDAIKKRHNSKYDLRNILNVEHNRDELKGDRFLVELELFETTANRSVRFSEYVYRHKGHVHLCYPEGFKWNKTAVVNIILTAGGNQGKWVNYFINNMARLYHDTQDKNFNVVIIDFHSPHLDVKRALEESGLPNYVLLENNGKFHKTLAIQKGLELIQDPNQIVFQCDLHINIPSNFIDDIRKHTIQGKVVYCPVVARLICGANMYDPDGFWEVEGYGMAGGYKSDWDAFGGMNVGHYQHSWGGEDWDMADRIMQAQLAMERLKVVNLFHYFHTKKGMWKDS